MRRRHAALALGALAAVHAAPALAARGPVRWALPGLSGVGRPGGVALTFDDGPDRQGTPAVLDALAALGWTATFFVLGSQVLDHPEMARRLVSDGHELALHGHSHRNHLTRTPLDVRRDLARSRQAVLDTTGVTPQWYRPPYGVLTAGTLAAARELGMTPVLWTAWGRDWARTDGPAVAGRVLRDLRDGGTVLLHDSDVTSTPGSWRATVGSLPLLAAALHTRGWEVRPLRDHLPAAARGVSAAIAADAA